MSVIGHSVLAERSLLVCCVSIGLACCILCICRDHFADPVEVFSRLICRRILYECLICEADCSVCCVRNYFYFAVVFLTRSLLLQSEAVRACGELLSGQALCCTELGLSFCFVCVRDRQRILVIIFRRCSECSIFCILGYSYNYIVWCSIVCDASKCKLTGFALSITVFVLNIL